MLSVHLSFQMGYLRKEADSSLVYTVVNQLDLEAEGLPSQFQLFSLPLILPIHIQMHEFVAQRFQYECVMSLR